MADRTYRAALNRLYKARLILKADASAPIDCHPLIREHFAHVMRESAPDVFRQGHARLFEHYSRSAPQYPTALEEMTPLFYAVYHGCQAERYQEAFYEIYYERIQRNEQSHLLRVLSAYGTDLSLINNFFRLRWTEPVSDLPNKYQSWLIAEAGLSLQSVGRLSEALNPVRTAAERNIRDRDWGPAAIVYSNLTTLAFPLGNLAEATGAARQAIEQADRSDNGLYRATSKAFLAACLHQLGTPAECARLFEEAERLQHGSELEFPILYSFRGYLYNDFLLDLGQIPGVLLRATQTLQKAGARGWLRDIGLDHVTLGRAHPSGSPESAFHLDQAVEHLRRSGRVDFLPIALLARGTQRDLEEVYRLATRCGMRLHLTDYHLAQARYLLRERRLSEARDHLDKAAALIAETSYHRRDRELAELRQALAATTPQP
ncbi:MAG TPA: hypothetical protein VMF91_06915 [Bryobacteraceae bacterium]|nr:hypothetical protein [Bryobacteraceae bacterium]